MKIVYKYGTGHPVPDCAKYLSTQVEWEETEQLVRCTDTNSQSLRERRNKLVWHYYEVAIDAEGNPLP